MKNTSRYIRKVQAAFSLIELLVVTAVAAVVASIAVPALKGRIAEKSIAAQTKLPSAYAQINPDAHAALDYAIAVTQSPENVARLIVKTNDANPEIGNITSFDAKLAAMKNYSAKYQTPQTVLDTMAQGAGTYDSVIAWIDIDHNGKLALRTVPKPKSV